MVPINGVDNLQKVDSRQAHLEVVNEVDKCLTGEALGESSFEQALNPEVIVAEAVSELCTDYLVGSIINVALNMQEIMEINTHFEDLERHLAGFRLEINHISKDGDCAFRSIVRQTLKFDSKEKKDLEHHLKSLNLLSWV